MWKDYEIAAEDIELYRALIPEQYIGPLWAGSLSGLAFIDTYSEDSPLVGIVLYRITNGYIEIEWAALNDDHGLPDHGADMIRMILNMARVQGDFRGVFGRFREGDLMSEFFYDDQFVMSREPDGIYRFRLSDVIG